MVGWYDDYLLHQNMTYYHGQHNTSHITGMGFPQGGVCSATFWSLAFDEAVRVINDGPTLGVAFADDCAVLSGGSDPDVLRRVQHTLDRLVSWGSAFGLSFKKKVFPTASLPNILDSPWTAVSGGTTMLPRRPPRLNNS